MSPDASRSTMALPGPSARRTQALEDVSLALVLMDDVNHQARQAQGHLRASILRAHDLGATAVELAAALDMTEQAVLDWVRPMVAYRDRTEETIRATEAA